LPSFVERWKQSLHVQELDEVLECRTKASSANGNMEGLERSGRLTGYGQGVRDLTRHAVYLYVSGRTTVPSRTVVAGFATPIALELDPNGWSTAFIDAESVHGTLDGKEVRRVVEAHLVLRADPESWGITQRRNGDPDLVVERRAFRLNPCDRTALKGCHGEGGV